MKRLLVLASVALYLVGCDGTTPEGRCGNNCGSRGYTYAAPGLSSPASCTCGPVEKPCCGPVEKPCEPVEAP